jgi:GTP pyrophosphokinase
MKKIIAHFNLNNKEQLYSEVGMGFLELEGIDEILGKKSENKLVKYWNITFSRKKKDEPEQEEQRTGKNIDRKKPFLLKEGQDNIKYTLAKCCNPIPGEKVIGYISSDDHIIIHKTGCKEVEKFLSSQGERIITAEWTKFKRQSYLTRLRLDGFDRVGIVNEVTNVISKEHNINMRSVKFDTNEGIFEGDLFLYIHNTDDLNNLIARLTRIKGIDTVSRVENLYD